MDGRKRPMSSDGAVLGSLDDRDGDSGEQIDVNLDKVDPNVCEIVFVVSIHDEGKTFGDVKGAFISVINAEMKKSCVDMNLLRLSRKRPLCQSLNLL